MSLLDYTYIPFGSDVVVACSGGGDSVALLCMMVEEAPDRGWRLVVAHLDHSLRAESVDEARITAELAAGLGFECIVERRDVRGERRQGESLESTARRVRYEFLRGVRDSVAPGGLIATGHTLDDQLETIALRLERKAGLKGWRGILPVRGDGVVRPLLRVERKVLRLWMMERGITWCEDASNLDIAYRRNYWRNRFSRLPPADYAELLGRSAELAGYAGAMQSILERIAEWWFLKGSAQHGNRAGKGVWEALLPGEILLEHPCAPSHLSALDNVLLDTGLNKLGEETGGVPRRLRETLFELWRGETAGTERGSSLVQLGGDLWAERIDGGLLLARDAHPDWENGSDWIGELKISDQESGRTAVLELPLGGGIEARSASPEERGALAAGTLPAGIDGRWSVAIGVRDGESALSVRYPRAGDAMRPFGMMGHKSLADLFGESGIPRLRRGRLPVVESGGIIMWVAGVRISEEARVSTGTGRALRLNFRVADS